MLNTYKYSWKTSYYQNTYDSKSDEDIEVEKVTDIISNDSYEILMMKNVTTRIILGIKMTIFNKSKTNYLKQPCFW